MISPDHKAGYGTLGVGRLISHKYSKFVDFVVVA